MIEKIRGKVKEIFNLVGSFLARIPAYLIPIVASVVLVIVLCVLVLCLSEKWESCIPSKMVPDYKESDGRVSFFWNDFNFYGIVATVLAFFSLLYTFQAYRSQRLTECNTRNASVDDQVNRFIDFARHEYRNLVVVMATAVKFFSKENQLNGHRIAYPSEIHILKLQAGPDDFVLDVDSQIAGTVSEMRLLLRNFNIEINVACKHLQRHGINKDVLYRDYYNLMFRPLSLVKKACEMEARMIGKGVSQEKEKKYVETLVDRSKEIMLTVHLENLKDSLVDFLRGFNNRESAGDLLVPESYSPYLEMLAKSHDLLFECDKTKALERSFRKLSGDGQNKDEELKPLLYTCKFDKYKTDFEFKKHIDGILEVLPHLQKISPKNFDWFEQYKNTLKQIKEEKEFDFMQFFPLMLKMDVIAKLPEMGMVNYE